MRVIRSRIANETDFVVDCLGQKIRVGDVISYPVRWCSSMEMHTARVDGIIIEKRSYGWGPNVTLQEKPVLKVSVHTANHFYKDVTTGIRYDKWVSGVHLTSFQEPCLRKSVIKRVDNVTVITNIISEGLADFYNIN